MFLNKFDQLEIYYKDFASSIIIGEYLRNTLDENTIILCIGTDKCIGDSLGPIIGTILKRRGLPLHVYGTLHEPIHALNIEEKLAEITAKHSSALVVAIDACLGKTDNIGTIQIKKSPIVPGKGVGKLLPSLGDISIVGIIGSAKNDFKQSLQNIRLSFILDMAETIAESFFYAF